VFAVLFVLALPGATAHASTSVAGSGEPLFTNTTTNTYHFGFNRFSSYGSFRLRFSYYQGAANIFNEYTAFIGSSGVASTGNAFANFTGVVNTLVSGTTYGVCANGQYSIVGDPTEFPEALASCSSSTIDRSTPVVSGVSVEGTATYSNKTAGQTLALAGLYSDSLSPPWPATYVCIRTNSDPATACNGIAFDYTPACSNRAGTGTQNNPFSCGYTVAAGDPDGALTFCARAADSSVPDVPGDPNQLLGLTSSNANLSAPACGYVILDRTAPQLAIAGGAPTATTGQLLSFSATAADPAAGSATGSGVSGAYTWSWGDNTANGAGLNASHTYTQPGTFEVKLTTSDNAGNPASATKTVVVSAPAGGGGTTGGGTTGGGATGGGTTGGGAGTGTGGTVTPPPTAQQIAQQTGASGPGATQKSSAGALDVLTAKKLRISAKLKALPLALTVDQPGVATFALVRGGRIVSQAGLKITKAGSLGFKLKLPRKLKSGKYGLKITFKATGAAKAAKRTISITFLAAKKAKKSSARGGGLGGVSGGAPATPGLGTARAPVPARGVVRR
jgi:hypothetical protein